MNLVKAADDIKNLSDQQLLSANQNPVMIPPYLVLAEMKRREQLRAQYAKAQQQQQPSVAQQLAQNLAQPQQGQPQQGAPQGPPLQGIMQAAPPQAMAMAQGGHVARYANGVPRSARPVDMSPYQGVLDQLSGMKGAVPAEIPSTAPTTFEEMAKMYPMISIQDKMDVAKSLLGGRDYSQYEEYLQQQMQEAKGRKARIGDALIAAGAAMASNRDPRVGLANLLAQGIGVGSQSYEEAKERKKKDIQTAMMAQLALNKMMQEDRAKQVDLASSLASSESGRKTALMQTVEANRRQAEAVREASRREQIRRNAEIDLEKIKIMGTAITNEIRARQAVDVQNARIASVLNKPLTQKEKDKEEAARLLSDSMSQAMSYVQGTAGERAKKGLSPVNLHQLALDNLRNPNYFKGYSPIARQLAASAIVDEMKTVSNLKNAEERLNLQRQRQAGQGGLADVLSATGSIGPTDYYSQVAGDAVSLGARPVD